MSNMAKLRSRGIKGDDNLSAKSPKMLTNQCFIDGGRSKKYYPGLIRKTLQTEPIEYKKNGTNVTGNQELGGLRGLYVSIQVFK